MPKSKNTKVNRLLGALAVELCRDDDAKIIRIHDVINDDRDGYAVDFIGLVNSYRAFLGTGILSVKENNNDYQRVLSERR